MAGPMTTETMNTSSYGVGSGVAAAVEAPGPCPQEGKGQMWRQELARQLQEMEQTVAGLRVLQDAETAAATHTPEAKDEATD
jgi:hypothetical protein